jgi:hypothetical protein
LLLHNWGLKLLALASAVLLWMAVAREPVSEIAYTVPIEFLHVPADVVLRASTAPEAQVWIRGPRRVLRTVPASELHVSVDLATVRMPLGERTFNLTPANIKAPAGVDVVQVSPPHVRLLLEPRNPSSSPAPGGTN